MNIKNILSVAILGVMGSTWGSGFGLYQPSARYHAMGGVAVGKAIDASANFANPATLTDLTNIEITVGFVTEHPRGEVSVARNGEGLGSYKMDPGLFWLPHCMIAVPLPADFTFGLGISAEYGLGTKFGDGWPMEWSCTETTVQGLVINPNIAYKVTDKWSVAAGLRWLYFDFEQYKNFNITHPLLGTVHAKYRLKGDNGWDGLGWQIGTKYDILDNLSVGLMYKALIETTIEGKTKMTVDNSAMAGYAAQRSDSADADISLPQSITFGANWDPATDWHVGVAFSWTEWSKFDALMFNVKPTPNNVVLNWKDTWRGSIGVAWDFIEDWTGMISYTYDMDSTDSSQESAMLPPASRHILAGGLSWDVGWGVEATVSYACIFMNGFDMHTVDKTTGTGAYDLDTEEGFCHAGGFSLTYRF